jgi:hypothetical protein
MHIDTNPSWELSNDHPMTRELTADEASLYWSTVENMMEEVAVLCSHEDQNGEIDPEDPEVSEAIENIEDSVVLCDLIEETAIWRLAEGSPSKVKDREHGPSGDRSESTTNAEVCNE